MEYALEGLSCPYHPETAFGFNPCCNGMFSKETNHLPFAACTEVLILVVMECFRKLYQWLNKNDDEGFNPCCNGMFSKEFNQLVF